MKKLILIFIMIGIYSVCQAKSWTSYTPLGTTPSDSDTLLINDVSDTEDDATGTVKSLAWLYVQSRDSDLTAVAALTTAAYGLALLEVATELAFQQLVNLEIGVDVQAYHENLEAIADADTVGSAAPAITTYDNASPYTSSIYGRSLAGTADLDTIMSIGVSDSDSTTGSPYIELDGVTETVDVLKPLTAPSIDAGMASYVVDSTPWAINASICKAAYFMTSAGSADLYVTLPADGNCNNTSGIGKDFFFYNNDPSDSFRITPPVGTTLYISNIGSCGANDDIILAGYGSIHLIAYSDTTWFGISAINATCE